MLTRDCRNKMCKTRKNKKPEETNFSVHYTHEAKMYSAYVILIVQMLTI